MAKEHKGTNAVKIEIPTVSYGSDAHSYDLRGGGGSDAHSYPLRQGKGSNEHSKSLKMDKGVKNK